MELYIMFVLGVLVGSLLVMIFRHNRISGVLQVEDVDPEEGPYLLLELTKDVDYLRTKKYVTFKVNSRTFISHK